MASELGIDIKLVRVAATDTAVISNSQPTAATTGTDLNGLACVDACRTLLDRLAAVDHGQKWVEKIRCAYESKLCLQALGYSSFENFAYRFSDDVGDWSYYYIFGCCVSEVEVDLVTGEFRILRVDIAQDCGQSVNPVIDVGQIEGGFMQVGEKESQKKKEPFSNFESLDRALDST